jgi:hypothetical protein
MAKNSSIDKKYLLFLEDSLKKPKTLKAMYKAIVNLPFKDKYHATALDLGIVVLLLVDPVNETIDRIALSDTEQAKGALRMSEKKFEEIRIPLYHDRNIIPRAIHTKKIQTTDNWEFLFTPELSAKAARFNQVGAGIACSAVSPLDIKDGGALIFSFFQPPNMIQNDHLSFIKEYTKLASKALSKML